MPNQNELNQEEIERLLSQSAPEPPAAQQEQPPPPPESAENEGLDPTEIEALSGTGGATVPPSQPPQTTQTTQPPAVADQDKTIGQDGIDKLLAQAGKSPPTTQDKPIPHANTGPSPADMAPDDVEFLLDQAQQALESIDVEAGHTPPGVTPFRLEEFTGAPASTENATLDLIRDVELDLKIELGRTHMYLGDVLRLRRGSVVPLDKLAGDPVDIYVNGRLIARGEVLVLNDNFCVRVAELLAGAGAGT
jgi:flagellar motor switch protein FliN/FliY